MAVEVDEVTETGEAAIGTLGTEDRTLALTIEDEDKGGDPSASDGRAGVVEVPRHTRKGMGCGARGGPLMQEGHLHQDGVGREEDAEQLGQKDGKDLDLDGVWEKVVEQLGQVTGEAEGVEEDLEDGQEKGQKGDREVVMEEDRVDGKERALEGCREGGGWKRVQVEVKEDGAWIRVLEENKEDGEWIRVLEEGMEDGGWMRVLVGGEEAGSEGVVVEVHQVAQDSLQVSRERVEEEGEVEDRS